MKTKPVGFQNTVENKNTIFKSTIVKIVERGKNLYSSKAYEVNGQQNGQPEQETKINHS